MSRPIPPELQALLDTARGLGIDVQIFGPGRKGFDEKECPCPVCTQDRALKAKRDTQTSQTAQPESAFGPGEEKGKNPELPSIDRVMSYLDRITTDLANHIAKIVTDSDSRSLARDQDLRRVTDELRAQFNQREDRLVSQTMRIANLENQFGELVKAVADLSEKHRKQVGLLHKRVTKRKGEIATKANRRMSAAERLARAKL